MKIKSIRIDELNYTTVILFFLFTFLSCDMENTLSIQEGFITLKDAELYYKMIGQGEPLVVLHGGPGFDHHHILKFEELADDYQVIFYDQRATGNSTGIVDSNSITVEQFANDLEEIRKSLKLKQMNLLGHSWGGFLGMYYGMKYPDNLNSLILLAPASASSKYLTHIDENVKKNINSDDSLTLMQIVNSKEYQDRESEAIRNFYRVLLKAYFYDRSLIDSLNLTLGENTIKNQTQVSSLLLKNLGDYDIHEKLSSIKCPTLIIHGDSDPLPYESSYQIHKYLPQSKLVILKNCGHWIYLESQNKVFSLIKRFLNDSKSITTSIPGDLKEKLKNSMSGNDSKC